MRKEIVLERHEKQIQHAGKQRIYLRVCDSRKLAVVTQAL